MNWKPIKTAPKDQSAIIVIDMEAIKGGRHSFSENTAIAEWWPYIGQKNLGGWVSVRPGLDDNSLWFIPTHWTDLPSLK